MKKQLTPLQFKVIQWLIYISFIFGMISQLNHTIITYRRLAPDETIIYAICFAASFDIFIGVAIMVGWKIPALIAAGIMVGINLICYNLFEFTNQGIAAIVISFIQPGMIYFYSVLIHDYGDNKEVEPEKKPYEGKKRGRKPGLKAVQSDLFVHIK